MRREALIVMGVVVIACTVIGYKLGYNSGRDSVLGHFTLAPACALRVNREGRLVVECNTGKRIVDVCHEFVWSQCKVICPEDSDEHETPEDWVPGPNDHSNASGDPWSSG